jgi:PKD repeat protein
MVKSSALPGRIACGLTLLCVGLASLAGCGTRNVGREPVYLAAAINTPANMRAGQDATWSAAIYGDTPPFTVAWNFGGGAVPNNVTLTDQDREISAVVGTETTVQMILGQHTVELTVTDRNGATFTATKDYIVQSGEQPGPENIAPTALLLADFTVGTAPLAVNFDASNSVDSDGAIANYEWDMDGDGIYGEAGAEAAADGTAQPATYTYTAPGTYLARVRVTDDGTPALSASASLTVTVNAPANQPPVTTVSADVSAGVAPLAVTFAADATDPDGFIANYQWDFDSDGTFDADTNTTPTAQYTYEAPGTYTARVRVTDNSAPGATATATTQIVVSAANQAPAAALSGQPLSGVTPLMVMFDASASIDPDGVITMFEWDYDNDGTFEESTGTTATAMHTYDAPGNYTAVVRVTDNGTPGLTATASVDIVGNANQPPTVSISAESEVGKVPFAASFLANAADPDGSITKYEWDFEDDGTYDDETGTTNTVQHTYDTSGNYTVRVRVTDDGTPGVTATASMQVTVAANQPPVAALTADDTDGSVPFTVNFDASASSDPDGAITLYEWDWESDGTYDFNSGSTPTTQHTFESQGEGPFTVTVRVTDDGQPLLSATATIDITVGPPNQAPTAIISSNDEGGSAPFTIDVDGSQSFDNDGTIALYEWDWENDGTFDDSSASPTAQHTYLLPGQYTITLRVTDDGNPGLTATDNYFVFVFPGGPA